MMLGVLSGVLLAAWSLIVPIAQAPDEAGHDALLFHVVENRSYPRYDQFEPASGVIGTGSWYRPDYDGLGLTPPGRGPWLTPENAKPRHDRVTFEELGGYAAWPFRSQLAQHPPGYYVALSPVAAGLDAVLRDGPIERRVLALRWTNALLALPIPLLAQAAARRLGASRSVALTAGLFPLAVPQFTHVSSSVNNDNLLNLIAAVLALLLAGVVRGDLCTKRAVLVGATTAVGLWVKAPAFSFVVWLAAAYLLPGLRDRRWRERAKVAVLAASTALVLGAPWWIRNVVEFGSLSPSILDGFTGTSSPAMGAFGWPGLYVRRVTQRFWGNFGSYVAPLDLPLVVALTALVVIAVAAVAVRGRGDRGGELGLGRVGLAAFAMQMPLLVMLMLAASYRHYRNTGAEGLMQGRYLFAAIVPLAVVVGVGLSRLVGRRAPGVMLAVVAIAQFDAFLAVLEAFWAEPDASLGRSLRAMVAWAPLPEVVTVAVLVGVVAAVVTLAGSIWTHREADTAQQPRPLV